jgi:uncharacterized protein (TIRG00374 family)
MKFSLLPLVGIIIFIYIILNIDFGKIFVILSNSNIILVVIAVLTIIFSIIIKTIKWQVLIKTYGINYPLSKSLKAWFMGFSLSMVTPARIGDFSRAYHLRKETSIGKGLTTVVIDRMIDIFILFILAIIGILNFFTFYTGYLNLLTLFIIFFCLFLVTIYLFTKKEIMKWIFKPLFNRFVPEGYKSSINFTFNEFYQGLEIIKNKYLLIAIFLGITSWLFSLFQSFLVALSLNLNISIIFVFSVMPIVILLDMLPISFSGIGTRDAALIFFLSFISLSTEYAISFSLMIFLLGYVIPGLIGSILLWKSKMKLDFIHKEKYG